MKFLALKMQTKKGTKQARLSFEKIVIRTKQ